MDEKLIAPCGMNCGLCVSYLAMKTDLNRKGFSRKYCPGCRPRAKNCTFMGCKLLAKGKVQFCYECGDFPCARLKLLHKRYRTKYHMSMLENLAFLRQFGINEFWQKQDTSWRCETCGGTICCHNGLCLECGLETLQRNKKYRWGER